MKMNFELIYKVRKSGHPTESLSNLRIGYENRARSEADKLHQKYLDLLKRELGTEDFEVTNVMCMADGIIGHVYVPGSGSRGIGKRKCCFCGCDDFDF